VREDLRVWSDLQEDLVRDFLGFSGETLKVDLLVLIGSWLLIFDCLNHS
jgi:hypothetical protein